MPDSGQASVIIPTYNAAATIERAVGSALAQTRPPLEIICIDDCSTDNCRAVLAGLAAAHPSVRVLHQPQNRGPSAARNAGIKAARGDWIAILDGDDAWRPERLENMLAAAIAAQADVVMDNIILHDLAAGLDTRRGHNPAWQQKPLDLQEFFENCRLGQFQYAILKAVVRRDFIIANNAFYPEDQRYGEDLIYYAGLLAHGARALLLGSAWYVYSTRIGEASGSPNAASRSQPDFAGIAASIDRFVARHPGLDAATRRAARACRQSMQTCDKLNRARHDWKSGKKPASLLKLMDPRVPALMLKMRLRARQVARENASA